MKESVQNYDILANMPELVQKLRMRGGKTGYEEGIIWK